jgi:3'(2'), 5'-bisphosphate nucleotidase
MFTTKPMHSMPLHEYLPPCCQIARDAGALIMKYFRQDFSTSHKDDNSPVTNADKEANQLIVNALKQLAPHIPVIAEEDETLGESGHKLFWLVDPLDGTRSFVRGEAEFTVNIGLIENGKPLLGIIYAPPQDTLYFGQVGAGAWRSEGTQEPVAIEARTPPHDGLVVVRSKSHPSEKTEAFLKTIPVKELISGGSSIKICMVADGSADIYPRFGRTMEWDTAAGHAIINAAGGRLVTPEGAALVYGKPGFENPHFIAYGRDHTK